MDKKTELKPCPFCGGEADIVIDPDGIKEAETGRFWAYNVVCKQCCATTGLTWSSERAAKAWNRRDRNA